ncbi:DUF998 domain-containing protein [Pseudonocardia sp.]|uniref:DUF998 domain-containing protein n=1 Tax=Pseudonocardia sp. TaxID=60912 RepID=UPI002601E9AE|nr:DUF998 domain-containing protein [Pseudonocardia sp.]
MDMGSTTSGTAAGAGGRFDTARRRLRAAAGWAGILGSAGFVLVSAALGLARPGYDAVAEPVVALAEGPTGWVQRVNLVALGVLVAVWAAGLHRGIRPTRWGSAGPILMGVSAVGPVLAGVTGPAPPHFLLVFVGAVAGFVVLSRRMAADPAWRAWATPLLVLAVAIAVVVPLHSLLALPAGAPLHPWWGLLNWAAVVLWLSGVGTLGAGLLGSSRRV